MWDTCWLSEKAMWRMKMMLAALQFPIPEGEFELDPAELIGRRMFVDVDHEEYDGKTRVRVMGMKPDGAFDPSQIVKPAADEKVPF